MSATETNLVISRLRLMEATALCWLIVVITSLLLKHAYGFQQFFNINLNQVTNCFIYTLLHLQFVVNVADCVDSRKKKKEKKKKDSQLLLAELSRLSASK